MNNTNSYQVSTSVPVAVNPDEPLKLKEIIWEFTSKCNKKCSYCGSKDIINKGNDYFDPMKICKDIVEASPEELVFSGGEPAFKKCDLISCAKFIKSSNPNIKLKILTNGTFFDDLSQQEQQLFEAVGWSINTLEDTARADEIFETYGVQIDRSRLAMVLNVGTHNIKDLEKIFQFALKRFSYLQIQLTMGEFQLNCTEIKDLLRKMETLNGFCHTANTLGLFDLQITIGDNMNTCPCSAGRNSLGITNDGYVIGCLSQRSFMKPIPEGNLSLMSLKEIWDTKFQKYRQSEYVNLCCKDCTGILKCQQGSPSGEWYRNSPVTTVPPQSYPGNPWNGGQNVFVYGVNIPSSTCVSTSDPSMVPSVTYTLSNLGVIGEAILTDGGPANGY